MRGKVGRERERQRDFSQRDTDRETVRQTSRQHIWKRFNLSGLGLEKGVYNEVVSRGASHLINLG